MNKFLIIALMIFLSGCSGTYCIKTGVEKYGVSGEICYNAEKSKVEGTVVFEDTDGNEIIGFNENDIKDLLQIIESGKKIWEFSKVFFGISIIETPNMRLQRVLAEYRKYQKVKE